MSINCVTILVFFTINSAELHLLFLHHLYLHRLSLNTSLNNSPCIFFNETFHISWIQDGKWMEGRDEKCPLSSQHCQCPESMPPFRGKLRQSWWMWPTVSACLDNLHSFPYPNRQVRDTWSTRLWGELLVPFSSSSSLTLTSAFFSLDISLELNP